MVINYYYIINRIRRRIRCGQGGQGGHPPYTEKNFNKFTHDFRHFWAFWKEGVSNFFFIENNELQEEKQSKLLSTLLTATTTTTTNDLLFIVVDNSNSGQGYLTKCSLLYTNIQFLGF